LVPRPGSRQAIRIKPDYPEAHYNLGMILYRLGRLTEAEGDFRQAARLRPDYLEAFIHLGLTLQDLQRKRPRRAHRQRRPGAHPHLFQFPRPLEAFRKIPAAVVDALSAADAPGHFATG
jgi:tetratricopeptide (TPR) repeat protein